MGLGGWIIICLVSLLVAGIGNWLASDEAEFHGPIRARYFIGGICMYVGGAVLFTWSLIQIGHELKS